MKKTIIKIKSLREINDFLKKSFSWKPKTYETSILATNKLNKNFWIERNSNERNFILVVDPKYNGFGCLSLWNNLVIRKEMNAREREIVIQNLNRIYGENFNVLFK